MTYWARDHQHALRRIGDVMRDLDYAYEDILPAIARDLRDDAHDETEDSRARLAESRRHLGAAMGSLELAREQLPTPRQESSLFPTAATVMEREG